MGREASPEGTSVPFIVKSYDGLYGRCKTALDVDVLAFYHGRIMVDDDRWWKGNSGLGVFSFITVSTA